MEQGYLDEFTLVKPERKRRKYYLAYGSNLDMQQMKLRCPGAKRRGTGEINCQELVYKGSKTGSYLTLQYWRSSSVPVGVFSVTEEDENRLDVYEGFPRFYTKKETYLEIWDEKLQKRRWVMAFYYVMREDRPFGIPSEHYIATCQKGYEDFGFDKAVLEKAYDRTLEMMRCQR